jgi:hypothetical protein
MTTPETIMTTPCGTCGFPNPDDSEQCAECNAKFHVHFLLSDDPATSLPSEIPLGPSVAESWSKLKLPAKCGPIEIDQTGECSTPDGFKFKATSEFENAPIRGGCITVKSGQVTVRLVGDRMMRLKFEENSWHLFASPSVPSLTPTQPRRLSFPGLTNLHLNRADLGRAYYHDDMPVIYTQKPLMAAHNGRSLVALAHDLVAALRQEKLPILISWAGDQCRNIEMRSGFYVRSRFIGCCWVTSLIECTVLGQNHTIAVTTGLAYWDEGPKEIKRIRRGYGPLALGGVVALAAYCLVAFGLGPLNLMVSTLKTSTGSVVFWRSIVALVLYWVAVNRVAPYLSKLHFPGLVHNKPIVVDHFRQGWGNILVFTFTCYIILSFYVADPPVGSQQPIPFSALLSAAPEVVLYAPLVLSYIYNYFRGWSTYRPGLIPSEERFAGLHNAISKVAADVLGR